MTLDAALAGNDAIATLGHELQHAVEVAVASAVVDGRSFEQFYRQVEDSCGVVCQAARLWSMDAGTCAAVLAILVDAQFLVQTRHASFMRA